MINYKVLMTKKEIYSKEIRNNSIKDNVTPRIFTSFFLFLIHHFYNL